MKKVKPLFQVEIGEFKKKADISKISEKFFFGNYLRPTKF